MSDSRFKLVTTFILGGFLSTICLGFAVGNSFPVLFPDTVSYSSVGDAFLETINGQDAPERHLTARDNAQVLPQDHALVGARSPFYGTILSSTEKIGSSWFLATIQVVFVSCSLLLIIRRLALSNRSQSLVIGLIFLSGFGFYSIALIPDVFLAPMIIAVAVLVTRPPASKYEQLFWVVALSGGALFHRGFLAVALMMIFGTAFAWRASWFNRRGWITASVVVILSGLASISIGQFSRVVYGVDPATPPFLLARMAEGRVLPAYLDDVCREKSYILCREASRLPMNAERFLWAWDGVYRKMPTADRSRIADEAGSVIGGAIMARPGAAILEATRYSLAQLYRAGGMTDFGVRIPDDWQIGRSLNEEMPNYRASRISHGTYPLRLLGWVAELTYLLGLLGFIAGVSWLVHNRKSIGPTEDKFHGRRLTLFCIIFAGVVCNAVVAGVISGVHGRYQGRVAWLVVLAAAAMLNEMRILRSRIVSERDAMTAAAATAAGTTVET